MRRLGVFILPEEPLRNAAVPGMTVAEFDRPIEMLKELVGGDDVPREFLADIERHGFKEFLCDKCYEQERRATESPVMVRITKAGRNN